ncbi:MAG: class I SAM-dependent methyltransferase, partial [Ktedonobacterales bacterium]
MLRERFAAAGGKPVYVRQLFGRIASVYDLMNRLMTGGLDRRWRRFAVRKIALGPGQSALDIGTGTGDLAIALARVSAPEARVTGVDFVPQMLVLAEAKARRMELAGRVSFARGDGERLDFADETFDACCSAFVVRNLADLRRGFDEMLRVTKPGGKVVCLEMSHPYNPLFSA